MATVNASDMTSGSVKSIHAGVNVKISSHLQEATVSAAGQINMMRLPGGAQVVDVKLMVDGVPGMGLSVKDNHSNTYMDTATAAGVVMVGGGQGFGKRLTSSAHIYIGQTGFQAAQSGADSANYRLVVSYISELSSD